MHPRCHRVRFHTCPRLPCTRQLWQRACRRPLSAAYRLAVHPPQPCPVDLPAGMGLRPLRLDAAMLPPQ